MTLCMISAGYVERDDEFFMFIEKDGQTINEFGPFGTLEEVERIIAQFHREALEQGAEEIPGGRPQ
jgi:hypothetical protein